MRWWSLKFIGLEEVNDGRMAADHLFTILHNKRLEMIVSKLRRPVRVMYML